MIGTSVVGAECALDQPGLLALGALQLDCPVPDVGAHLAAGAGGAGVHPAGDHQLYTDQIYHQLPPVVPALPAHTLHRLLVSVGGQHRPQLAGLVEFLHHLRVAQ